jgi:hypothetical protein
MFLKDLHGHLTRHIVYVEGQTYAFTNLFYPDQVVSLIALALTKTKFLKENVLTYNLFS